MDSSAALKTIRNLIGQTPLIINPDRDAKTFQTALAAIPTERLQAFYRDLSGEDRRRFHYVANICLGFESWSRLFQELVIQETQARLSDRLAESYSHREDELHRREDDFLKERGILENEVMRLDGDNHSLRRENLQLKKELADAQQTCQNLQRQQQQLLDLVERYKHLLQELKRLMAADKAKTIPGK